MTRAMAAVLLGALALVVGAAPALAATGPQTFVVFAQGPPGTPRSVVAAGPITGIGTVQPLGPATATSAKVAYVFPQGTVFVNVNFTDVDGFEPQPPECLASDPLVGTFQIVGGTGAFAGATGGGTFSAPVNLVALTPLDGDCVPPVVFTVTDRVFDGTATVPDSAAA